MWGPRVTSAGPDGGGSRDFCLHLGVQQGAGQVTMLKYSGRKSSCRRYNSNFASRRPGHRSGHHEAENEIVVGCRLAYTNQGGDTNRLC